MQRIVNPLSPSIKIKILLTALHTFSYSINWENLLKDQSNFPLMAILFILMTSSLDYYHLCIDIVRRNLMLVSLGAYRVNAQ